MLTKNNDGDNCKDAQDDKGNDAVHTTILPAHLERLACWSDVLRPVVPLAAKHRKKMIHSALPFLNFLTISCRKSSLNYLGQTSSHSAVPSNLYTKSICIPVSSDQSQTQCTKRAFWLLMPWDVICNRKFNLV